MKILVTGSDGFVGKNLISTLNNIYQGKDNTHNIKISEIFEYDVNNTFDELDYFCSKCDVVVNLAGINRPTNVEEFYEGNALFSKKLCDFLKRHKNKSIIINSSSIQAEFENDYGKSKVEGEKYLNDFGLENGNSVYNYRFANLFGKWCRPNYNSVVATWCYNVANGLEITVNDETVELPLCYIDDVVEEIIHCIEGEPKMINGVYSVTPIYKITLGELAKTIQSFQHSRVNLQVVKQDNLTKKLYATYLSYLPTDEFSYDLKMNIDERGSFTEFLKTEEYGQVSVNISRPGITKGNHWHHTKNEKFLVVSGEGIIRFRNIFNDEVIEYKVSGSKLQVLDIPTGYTHNIENLGECDMVTIMWANETFEPLKPDTYFSLVK